MEMNGYICFLEFDLYRFGRKMRVNEVDVKGSRIIYRRIKNKEPGFCNLISN